MDVTKSWPVSYSVSSQGTSPLQAPQQTADTDVEPIDSVSEPSSDPIQATVVPPVEELIPQPAEESTPESEPATKTDNDTSQALLTPQIVATDEVCGASVIALQN